MTDEFDRMILELMPNFIAVKYQAMLQAKTPEEKVRHAIRIYELSVRGIAIVGVTQYLIRDAKLVSDSALNRLLLEKLPFATLNTWQQILFAYLKAYEGKRELFFIPELYDFYWETSTLMHHPRSNVESDFDRLTQVYNDLWHEDSQIVEKTDWISLNEELEILIQRMLQNLMFFTSYDLIRITKKKNNSYWYDKHKGLAIEFEQSLLYTEEDLKPGLFYLSKENRSFLNLHPLLIFWDESLVDEPSSSSRFKEGLAVYERFSTTSLSYILTDLWQRVANEKSVVDFVRLLYYSIEQFKIEKRQADRLTWWQLQEISRAISTRRMASVMGKYRAELYLQRQKTKTSFDKFLTSDKVCFVLTGKSGIGKSNFLLAIAESIHQQRVEDYCMLFYNGAKLNPDVPLTTIISQEFNNYLTLTDRESKGIVDIWQEIAQIENIDFRNILLCIDAINENPEPKKLLKQIDGLVETSPWPWLKIVITSRPQAWRTMKRRVRLAEALYYQEPGEEHLGIEMESFSFSEELKPFSRDELPMVYEKYQTLYELKTTYFQLPSDVKVALQDPLVLRLVADIYQEKELPAALKIGDIYKEYINSLLRSGRLIKEDLRFLEREIVALMIYNHHLANTVTAKQINETKTANGQDLFDLIHHNGLLSSGRRVNQSFINLVDAELLIQLGEGEDYEIAFKFERFYDHYAGRRLFEIAQNTSNLEDTYIEIVEKIQMHPYVWGGIKNALISELKRGNLDIIILLCQTNIQLVKELMVAVLTDYGIDRPQETKIILSELLQMGEKDLSYKHKLLSWQNVESSRPILNAQKTAVEVAGHLGAVNILTSSALDRSASVRAHSVREIIHLWRTDRDRLHKKISHNRGFKILQNISENVRPGTVPNVNAVESGAGVMLTIFTESYQKINAGIEKDLEYELQRLTRKGLEDLLYIGKDGVENSIIRNRIRNWVLSVLISFSIRVLNDTPEHVTANTANVSPYFKLEQFDKDLINVLLPYFDPNTQGIESLKNNVHKILDLNDTFITFTLWLVLLVQWENNKEDIVDIITELFEHGIKQTIPPYACTVSIEFLTAILRRGKDYPNIEGKFDQWIDQLLKYKHGRVKYSGGVYVKSMYVDYIDAMYGRKQKVDIEFLKNHAKEAIIRQDNDLLSSIIFDLGLLIPETKFHSYILNIITDFNRCISMPIWDEVVNLIARLRQYSPDEVDDFLLDEGWSDKIQKEVKVREVVEQIGGDFLQLPIYTFLADSVVLSNKMRVALQFVMGEAKNCQSADEFLNIVIKTIFNLAYQENIFK